MYMQHIQEENISPPKHTSFNYKLFYHLLLGVKCHFQHYTVLNLLVRRYYHDSQFYWWKKLKYREKTMGQLQDIEKLFHIYRFNILYHVHIAHG